MNYKIVSSDRYDNRYSCEEALSFKINKLLEEGWELQGGVTSSFFDVDVDYAASSGGLTRFKPYLQLFQAVIKHENKNDKGKF